MPIKFLSPQDSQRQVGTFVDFFEKEFMAEINYLEETARENIPARTDASLTMVFNVACALVSLAPIPGGVLAFMAIPHVLNAVVKIGTVAIQNDWSQKAIAMAAEYLSGDIQGQVATLQGAAGDKYSVGEDMPIDTASLSVLARWLGVQLARRYEQVLTERLSQQPDQALMGLARVAARRCLAYLSENPLPKGNHQVRTEHLLSGVLVGAALPWYHRPLNMLKTGESLQGRDEAEKLSFTAEKLFVNGAWMNDSSTREVCCYTSKATEWIKISSGLLMKSAVPLGGLPTYGYVTGRASMSELELKPYAGTPPDLIDWQHRRLQQPVTREEVSAYLSSVEVKKARAENRTASQSFIQFLHQRSPGTFSLDAQAVLSDDLSKLELRSGNFQDVDFSGSRLSGDISYASFERARLLACTGTALRAVAGSTVNFAEAELGFSTLSDGKFDGTVNFTQANLTCVDLTSTTFGEVEHVGAVWHKAVLTNINYHGIRDAQAAQVTEMAAEQTKQRAQLRQVNDQIQALEARMQPLLEKCDQQTERREQLESLLVAQVNRLKFEAYATEKLEQLSHQSSAHSDAIARLGSTLTTVREERAEGERLLQNQIDQLQHDVSDLKTRARRNSEDKLAIKAAQQATQEELVQLRIALTQLAAERLSSTATPEEKEAFLEKSAIAKILTEYDKALSQKLQDLVYYVRPDVVDHVPDSMSSAEYVSKIETQEIENKTRPLLSEVDDYLQSNDQVMLLLGDPGAGKSLFSWYSTQSRLNQYQKVLQGLEPSDTPWLPIVIELKNYRLSEIKNLLPRYLAETCHITPEEQIAIQNDQKPKHRILLVLDGFDELKQEVDGQTDAVKKTFEDCLTACGANAWYAGQIKVVVTCRLRHLPDTSVENRYFGHGLQKNFRHRVVLPFSSAQIATYLDERIEAQTENSHLLPAAQYIDVMDKSTSIKAMVRNPFVLRLFVDALPELQQQGRDLTAIKRYDIYRAFVTQWFIRETARLPVEVRAQLGLASGMNASAKRHGYSDAEATFESYTATLANEMYRQDSLVVSMSKGSAAFNVWRELEERVFQELDSPATIVRLTAEYQILARSERIELQKKSITSESDYIRHQKASEEMIILAGLNAFKITSPLKQQGDVCSFIHKSFYEFFLAQSILQNAGSEQSLETRVANTLTCLSSSIHHASRRIQNEPQALLFLEDIWIGHTTDRMIQRVKETFFAVIEASKKHPEHGAAAANTITMLNWMGTMLVHQSWQDIQIPGANLSYAVLAGSDLTRANLRGARLFRAQLGDVNLTEADVTDVDFMERAPITSGEQCQAIACHPTKPWIAMASGINVRQYDTERNAWVGEPLTGHTDKVESVSYSSDGVYLASANKDNTIRQWVAATGQPFGPVLEGHTEAVTSVSYSPNGTYLASASEDNTIRQWVAATGETFGPLLVGHTDKVNSVAYSPDGVCLVSGSDDKTIRQWVVATGESFGPTLIGHTNKVRSVIYSPSGTHLVSGSQDKTIRQWVAATGEPFGPVLVGHTSWVNSVHYSPAGTHLASGSLDSTIRQWVAATGEPFGPVLVGHICGIFSVSYLSAGTHLASASQDGTIRQWAISRIEPFEPVLAGHTGNVNTVAYSPNGKVLLSSSSGYQHNLYDAIRQWMATTGESFCPALNEHTDKVNGVAYSPDGVCLASGSDDKTIRQWVAATGKLFGPVLEGHTRRVTSVCYSTNEKTLASGSYDCTIRQWVAATGEPFGPEMAGHSNYVTSVSYSPTGTHLASGSGDKTVRQWVAATGESFGPILKGHTNDVNSISYSPSGTHLASGSDDKTIRQWVAATGKPFGPILKGHTNDVNSISYSPSGAYLASGSKDNTIRQWVAATGKLFGPVLRGHSDSVKSVSYSPFGTHLASAGGDQRICVWNSGVTGDFSLIWCTRSGGNLLMTHGLRLHRAVGLRADQLALLAYAGYTKTTLENLTSAASRVSHNVSTIFAQKKAAVSSAKAENFTAESASLQRRFVDSTTFNVLHQKSASATMPSVTKNEFESRQFDFNVSVDIIKTLADFYFGEKKHNIDRGTHAYSSMMFKKVNLSKELRNANASSASDFITGTTILKLLQKCEGVLVENNRRGSLHAIVDVAWLNALLETEQRSRGLNVGLVHAVKGSASPS